MGILANSPTLYAQKIVYLERSQRWTCVEIWEPAFIEGGYKAFTIVLFVFFYLFPLLTMSILYSCVIYKLWVRKVPGNQISENQQRSNKSRKKVLKMLLAVVILFAVCRFPVYITQFIRFFGEEDFPCGAPKTWHLWAIFWGMLTASLILSFMRYSTLTFEKDLEMFYYVIIHGGAELLRKST